MSPSAPVPVGAASSPASLPVASPASSPSAPPPAASPPSNAPTGSLVLLTEPQAGTATIDGLITGAKSRIDLTMYELNDPVAEADLAAAAARGVAVRVILDQHFEKERNAAAYADLVAHGVQVAWGPAGTTYHQKTLTVDRRVSVIMTLNFVSADYPGTRDFAVIDTDPSDVAAIEATFAADFIQRPVTPPEGTDLVWSPTNATSSILSVINGATRTLGVENEEMSDGAVVQALVAAARRGVDVEITMTADSEYDAEFAELTVAGAHVHLDADSSRVLYIHAKATVADAGLPGGRALVGSENFSVASLDYNRELGLVTPNATVVGGVAATLAADFSGAPAFTG